MRIKYLSGIVLVFTLCFVCQIKVQAQSEIREISGIISYKNNQSVYVKFGSTTGLNKLDTLYKISSRITIPALIINNLSSISAACVPISNMLFSIGDTIVGKIKIDIIPKVDSVSKPAQIDLSDSINSHHSDISTVEKVQSKLKTQLVSGRLSISMNGDIQEPINSRYTGLRISNSFQIINIKQSNLSFESYITYRHRYGIDNYNLDFFDECKFYNLAIGYENTKHNIWFGRRTNYHVSNIGALDGLQYERKYKLMVFGLLAGFRPDIYNYGVNLQLPQFSFFISTMFDKKNGPVQFSIAIAEQQYHFRSDRRFAYSQYSSNPIKNLNFFISSEFDLYKKTDSLVPHGQLILTSVYSNLRYKFSQKLNVQLSYDNRKNIIYFESYKNTIDKLLDQETRQGLRSQINYNIIRNISINSSAFFRFQGAQFKPTKNYLVYLQLNQILRTKISGSINANYLETQYIKGVIYGFRFYRDFIYSKLNVELDYRILNYLYSNSDFRTRQQLFGINLNYRLTSLSYLSVNIESDISNYSKTYRYYITVNQRFKNKTKKN